MARFESSDSCNGNVAALARRAALIRAGKRLGCLALAAAIACAAFRAYGSWRKQHLGRQVEQFVTRGEYGSAVLVARRLLELDQNNLAASTAMAVMAEKAGRPEAVVWRQRIAHLLPGSTAAQLALARAALRFAQQDLAEHVLEAVSPPDRRSVEYEGLAGASALARNHREAAEAHFAAAAQLAPNEPRPALNLASVRLASSNPAIAEAARAEIARLAGNEAVQLDSLRALTADAVAHGQRSSALKWASQLRSEKEATFSDALLCFEALEGTDHALAVLDDAKTKALASAGTTAELITWLNRHGMAVVAAHWSKTLPKQIFETQPVPLAIAESYSFLQDWTSLQAAVEGKNWGYSEAFRLAVESHALRRLGDFDHPSNETQTTWRTALAAAKKHPEQLPAIAQLAEGWGYQDEAEEAWWLVAGGHPKPGLDALQRIYKTKQDTPGLLRVARRAMELNPGDLVATNNCASLGLLLTGDSTARRLAAKLHQEHPTNHAFAATCAFALQIDGKLEEALKLMETLREEELRVPPIAAYYLVLLVESGHLDRARLFLPEAKRAVLLPEEKQLLGAATRKLIAGETKNVADRRTR